MPLEGPQLLNPYLSNRPVQEGVINKSIVSVDSEMHHFVSGARPLAVKIRRLDTIGRSAAVLIERASSSPHTVTKDWDSVSAFNISGFPIPFNGAALNLSLSWARIKNPAICPIAGFFLSVALSACSHDVGSCWPTMVWHTIQSFLGHRA